jgi:D-alanine-D-alanine ligase
VIEKSAMLGWPVYAKPATLGSSIGVSRVGEASELAFAVDTVLSYDRRCIIEKGVDGGMDVNVSVLRDPRGVYVSRCERPIKDDEVLDYATKYLRGSKQEGMAAARRVIPADIPDDVASRVQEMARLAFTELNFNGVARVDFLVDPNGWQVFINEINAIPGSLALYFWELEGITSVEVIDRVIQEALSAQTGKQRTLYSITQAL